MTSLAHFKSDLQSLLADDDGIDGWDDAVLEQAIRQGLADYVLWSPPVDASYEATVAGYEQDLASLAPAEILAVAYPWADGDRLARRTVTWRLVKPARIRLDSKRVGAGETLRVRFRQAYTIADLDGATTTTLPAQDERVLVLAAAVHAYLLRYRQLSRRPSSAPGDLAACKELAEIYRMRFEAILLRPCAEPGPAWGEIGL